MAIITISRGCCSHGEEIAGQVAKQLDYTCISREILLEASHFFDVEEIKLAKSIQDAPSLMERITHGKEKYLNYIQSAFLEHTRKDNVVYHGHAGHFLMPRIRHVIKVRVIADIDKRIELLCRKKGMTADKAREFIEKEDRKRTKWTRYLYEVDMNDPSLYDMVIHIDRLKISEACDIICACAESDSFKPTEASLQAVSDLAVSSRIRSALHDLCNADVTAENGVVQIRVHAVSMRKTGYARPEVEKEIASSMEQDILQKIGRIVEQIPGVKDFYCKVEPPEYK